MVTSLLFLLLLHCKFTLHIRDIKTTFPRQLFAVFKGAYFQPFAFFHFWGPFFFLHISNVLIPNTFRLFFIQISNSAHPTHSTIWGFIAYFSPFPFLSPHDIVF